MTTPTQPACTDPNCPLHGGLKTRGAITQGTVVSTKAAKMAVVEIPYTQPNRKYERLEKRRSKIHAHVPGCMTVHEGDRVQIAECRKISKTKAFVVTGVVAATHGA